MKNNKRILVIGSGPIVIGQAAEFDHAGTQACKSLKEEGCYVILVNSNNKIRRTMSLIVSQFSLKASFKKIIKPIICFFKRSWIYNVTWFSN